MGHIGEMYQSGDWKSEKHVPVIECPDTVKADKDFDVHLSIGKEIAHPNTTEHHIMWIKLYYKPEGGKFPYEIGNYTFNTHGASTEGADQGPAYSEPAVTVKFRIKKPGALMATSYCNIHGLWQNSAKINVS